MNTPTTPRLHGYSERGLVNALFDPIVHRADGLELLEDLLNMSWPFIRYRYPRRLVFSGTLIAADIYVEPSLSQYGNPDAVVITTHRRSDGVEDKMAWFVEAKVETFASSAKMEMLIDNEREAESTVWLRKNSSSIVHELFLKGRCCALLKQLPAKLADGVPVYCADEAKGEVRKLGGDPLVLALANELRDCVTVYYVALTTDRPPNPGAHWYAGERAFEKAMCSIETANNPNAWPLPTDMPRADWPECTNLWSWAEIYDWACKRDLAVLRRALEENETKLRFELSDDDEPFRLFFEQDCGLRAKAQSGDKLTWYDDDGAVFTTRVRDGLRGGAVAEIYLRHNRRTVYVDSSELEHWPRSRPIDALLAELDKKVLRAPQ